ncbi:MAG: hypothetical protein IH846_04650 [Acidobacteria bacterium]|nr:hypothetical protein [Acidobacteriota bacterium]
MRCVICLLLFAEALAAQTFPVVLKKRLWPDGGGQIEITEQAIVYRAEKEPESRTWNYPDIQFFDRISSREFTILTYEDQRWKLGRDRQFHFTITEGELTDALFQTIRSRLDKPAANRVIPRLEAVEYEVAVKHLHTFGGCEGTLRFTEDAIAYVTADKEDKKTRANGASRGMCAPSGLPTGTGSRSTFMRTIAASSAAHGSSGSR